jgi:hypothetical protein
MGPTQKRSPLIPSGAAGTPGDKKWFVWKKKGESFCWKISENNLSLKIT